MAKEVAKQILKALDDELFGEHPEDWKSVSFRKRTRVTRFGSFKVKIYKDKEGNSHFYVDNYHFGSFRSAPTPLTPHNYINLNASIYTPETLD